MAFLHRFAPFCAQYFHYCSHPSIAPAVRLPSARRQSADNAPKTHRRRAGGGFYYPDTAKALNGAHGLSRAFYGGEGKIHEKKSKNSKNKPNKKPENPKTAPFPARTAKKSTKKTSVQNRTEPNRTEPNRTGHYYNQLWRTSAGNDFRNDPRRQMTCFLQPLRNLPRLRRRC